MLFRLQLVKSALRPLCLLACIVNFAAGAPLHSVGETGNARTAVTFDKSTNGTTDEDAMPAIYKWNITDKQMPLLGLSNARLSSKLDQSLSYPLGQFSFPIFQALNYDDEQGKFLLPSISSESKVHFIEFESTEVRNIYISNDGTNIKLIDNDNLKTIRTSSGTKYIFVRYPDGEFRCSMIKEASGEYLSLIYRANGLSLHGVVDSTGRTLTFNYTSEGITSLTQTWMANSEGLSKTWVVNDSQATLVAIPLAAYSKAARTGVLKAIPNNALSLGYTPEMAASDKTLAQVFGGPTAVAAGNGFEPTGLAASYPLYRGDIMGDDGKERRGHLSFAMHLYGNSDGTADSALYVPAGFASHSGPPSPTDAVVTFYYPRLGNLTNVTLAIFHVADFEISTEGNRVRIGNLGGPGGSSPLYKHSHIEFYSGNTGLPPLRARPGLRINPATIFTAANDSSGK